MILAYWEDSPAFLETSMNVTHSTSCDSKAVIKYACGHEFLAFQDFLSNPRRLKSCPLLFFKLVRYYAKILLFVLSSP